MSDRQAFESHLAVCTYDSDTRKVFSDWLDENGFYDEATEQRRMATKEWVEAHRHLMIISSNTKVDFNDLVKLGEDITNEFPSSLADYFDSFGGSSSLFIIHWEALTGKQWGGQSYQEYGVDCCGEDMCCWNEGGDQ